MAGLTLITLLVAAPAAGASTVSVSGSSALYTGDPSDDTVTLRIDSNDDGDGFYFFDDDDGVSAEPPCFERRSGRRAVCRITDGLGYEIDTGDGADTVTITDDAPGGSTDLGTGNDSFAGGGAADTAAGGDGDDVLKGGAGNDDLSGGAGTDQVGGEGGADAVRGGPGNDQLEFGGDQMAPGAGLGADVIEGGLGFDRLSYNDHAAGVRVSLDDRAGDGSAGENDNVRGDVEVVVGSTLDDTLTGNDGAQQLFGNAGFDRIDGLGGDDIVNGGTGGDELYGGGGRDRMEGSAGEDYLEGGAGEDIFEGDNVCTAEPCTGGSDFIQAVDGEADTVNCGVGADTALVDDIDVVAVDTQHGCERVERSATGSAPAPAAPAAPAAGGGVVGGAAFEPRLHVRGVRRLATLRRGKFRLEVSCPGSCKVKARLISGRTVVASKSRLRLGAGAVVLKPRMSKLGRRLLKHRTRVALTLAVDVTDDQGRVVTLVRSLRFRR